MAARRQFQGQFGINETPLTIAIESGNFGLAEEIILSTSDMSYLNDDFERSPSPFEELVICYEILKYFVKGISDVLCDELEMYLSKEEVLDKIVNNTVDVDGRFCTPNMYDCERLIEQTSMLIDVFLECGGDPNVVTTFGHKTLFHWIVEHDLELSDRFLRTSRVNINLCDVHGNSPLMDAILKNEMEDSIHLYEAFCEVVDPLDVNSHNCVGETALFRANFVGATEVSLKLCGQGAKVDSATCVSQVPVLYSKECEKCASHIQYQIFYLPSPLLASLLSDAPSRLRYSHVASYESDYSTSAPHKHLIDKLVMSSISPIIDHSILKTHLLSENICSVSSLLEYSNFHHLRDGRISLGDLVNLMFGQLSAGLRQLCIRKIFDHVLVVSDIRKKQWPTIVWQNICIKDCKGALNEGHMSDLVEMLGLPQSFKIFFEIEAAKYQLCKIVMSLQCLECQQACSESDISMYDEEEEEDDSLYPSDLSSDPNGSILFSSDILSEESSEEVDDLSDADLSDSGDEQEVSELSIGSGEKDVRRKIKCNYVSQGSSSENIHVTVETLCEDIAESMAQQHHRMKCKGKYQRFSEECTESTTSNNDISPPLSESGEMLPDQKPSSDGEADEKLPKKLLFVECDND
ncbi:hypothetical protein SK128_018986 [Halocaridina rubra]|uniref:Uncharacterized protein n=1 Tax=Halocaridina rubra TaxID=373956 RepID=A0AAN9A6Z1_HALRR